MLGGDGNDSIWNRGANSTADGGAGDDYIWNNKTNVSLLGGEGNDEIRNEGANVSIVGGAGDDTVSLNGDGENSYIRYNLGDGNDTIWGLGANTTLNILADDSVVSSLGSGDDVIVTVGENTITLKNARVKPAHIIIGAGGTSGGGSGSSGGGGGSGSGGGSSSGSGGSGGSSSGSGGSGGSSGGSGGSGGSSGSGGSLGNKSAMGSRGRGTSTSSNTSGGNTSGVTPKNSRINLTETVSHVEFPNILTPSTQQTATVNQRIYSGGNQIITNYQSGQKIIFADVYTGAFYDAEGNFCVGSATGALVIQNAKDKVIDLSDAAGNAFIKAYAASNPGIIDGRGLAGFELINGSNGADAIFAGDGGSQLWGGSDVAADALVGGNGTDIFIGGRTQGADVFSNASSADIVHLNDTNLSDIVATAEQNGAIAIAFNTGNVVGVQSSEALSATFMLADGSKYRYNHATHNWQSA